MALVWVASYPKSGNTWVRLFFRAFAAIRAGEATDRILGARGPDEAADADARWFAPLAGKPLAECSLSELAALRPRAQAAIARSSATDVFVKTHNMLGLDRGQMTINPDVTRAAVYVTRDPRDVAVSYRAYLGLDHDGVIEHMLNPRAVTDRMNGAYWMLSSWARHVDSWTLNPPKGVVWMRYEDMLASPKSSFRTMLRALNVAHSPGELKQAVAATGFEKLSREESATGFSETPDSAAKFFRKGKAGDWRDTLTEAQAARLTDAFGAQMERLGYAV